MAQSLAQLPANTDHVGGYYGRHLGDDFHGGDDAVVPPDYSREIVDIITSEDITYTLVKAGDHSLSRPQDLQMLQNALQALCR